MTIENANGITLSINRWHKVRGRLTDELKNSRAKALSLGGVNIANPMGTPDQLDSIQTAKKEAQAAMRRFTALADAVAQIKSSISAHSTQISNCLARLDSLNARLSLANDIIDAADNINNVKMGDLAELAQQYKNKEGGSRFSMQLGVHVSVMDTADMATLRSESNSIKKEAFALQEEIASLNQKKVTVVFVDAGTMALVEDTIGI